MLIETTVLVLGAALLHAAWNTLVKTAANPLVSMGALSLVTAAAGLLLVGPNSNTYCATLPGRLRRHPLRVLPVSGQRLPGG